MRRVVYVIGDYETTSYEKARKLQPTGQLVTRLDEIKKEIKVNPETLAKRMAYFAKRRAERAEASI